MLADKMTAVSDLHGAQTADAAEGQSPQAEPLDVFLHRAVVKELEQEHGDSKTLKDLSKGLEWLKSIIDAELDKRVESRLLTYKLLYAGYFGSKGRKARYANNPCAIRDAIRFCKDNDIPPPDWTLDYIYGLMLGVQNLPSEQDEKRWKTLMKLLDLAAEWDKKASAGMDRHNIELYFRRRGVSDEAIELASSFITEPRGRKISDLETRF